MNNSFLSKTYILFIIFVPAYFVIFYQPGLPLLSVSRFYIAVWLLWFVYSYAKTGELKSRLLDYPFLKPVIILFIALFFVSILAQQPISSFKYFLSIFLEMIIPTMLVWTVFETSKEINTIFRWLIIVGVIISLYGTISYLMHYNLLLKYGLDIAKTGPVNMVWSAGLGQRVGLVGRAQSVFVHYMNYGHFSVIFIFLSMLFYSITSGKKKYLYLLLIPVFFYSMLSTNSRSPVIFLVSGFFVFWVNTGMPIKIKFFLLLLLSFCLLYLYAFLTGNMSYYNLLIEPLLQYFKGDTSATLPGSSMSMRLEQLRISINIFWEHPFMGHGLTTLRELTVNHTYKGLFGGESFVYFLLVDVGLVGILAYLYFYGYLFRYFFSNLYMETNNTIRNISNTALSIIFGHLVFIIATGEMNTSIVMFMIIVLLAKYIEILKREEVESGTLS